MTQLRVGPPRYKTSSAKLTSAGSRVSAVLSGERWYIRYREPTKMSGQSLPYLLLEHSFDLSDLFLNFAGVFFGVAFGL
jgi:hypothetical protein